MINRVELSANAEKDLLGVPYRVAEKLRDWMLRVREQGLEQVRKVPGFHDERLKGKRAGQRSIRLSIAYRAIYILKSDGVKFVSVEEVNKHEY